MEIFLEKVAADLFEKHGENIHRLTVVFPNRRAGIFFVNYLNKLVKQPLISPCISTISELFATISPYFVPDRLNLIFRLYKVYIDLTGSSESFDDFYYWGGMLIGDFDQADKYLVNARDLFTNITDLKEIDNRFSILQPENKEILETFWKSVLTENSTSNQIEFVRLWKDLANIYERYKTALHKEGLAYEGMLYRHAIEGTDINKEQFFKEKQFVFVGFNALNKCEEALFDYLTGAGMASFYWDWDNYYLNDPSQEAGMFMRKNIEKYPQTAFEISRDNLAGSKKAMQIINIASQVGQAQIAGEELSVILSEKGEQDNEDTAIVLCDEELLLPVISALPEQAWKVNITMGFPFNLTPVFSLMNLLCDLQKHAKKEAVGARFYHKSVLAVLNHQLVLSVGAKECRELCDSIKTNNLVYLPGKELFKNQLLTLIFASPGTISELSDYFPGIIKYLFVHSAKRETGENPVLFREYLYQAYLAVNKLKNNIIADGRKIIGKEEFISANTYYRLLFQYLNELIIPFEGEPVEGVQIMGILETRALDFRNIILLSMNDGVMPKIAVSGSFIPYNLRRVFGLPVVEEQNAIYAYYFYRLLQRAEKVTFVYNSGANGLMTGEKSRYLYQLQLESGLDIPEIAVTYKMDRVKGSAITIHKDERVISSMKKYSEGEKLLSPTALDKYLTCSLQFYFRYVAGLEEPDEVADEVDAKVFGLLFHKSIEGIYRPYVGREVNKADLENIIGDNDLIEKTISCAFRTEYFKGIKADEKIELSGKNKLIFEILKKYICQLLEIDRKRAPFFIEDLEIKGNTIIPIGNSGKVSIGGIIDRIDRQNGNLQVLDYKTGKTELSFPMLDSLFERNSKNRNKAAFQTFVYSYVLHKNRPGEKFINPGIFNLRDIFDEEYDAFLKSKETGNQHVEFVSIAGQFEKQLRELLNETLESG